MYLTRPRFYSKDDNIGGNRKKHRRYGNILSIVMEIETQYTVRKILIHKYINIYYESKIQKITFLLLFSYYLFTDKICTSLCLLTHKTLLCYTRHHEKWFFVTLVTTGSYSSLNSLPRKSILDSVSSYGEVSPGALMARIKFTNYWRGKSSRHSSGNKLLSSNYSHGEGF